MIVLGIETSCDETSVAIVKDGREVLSNVISSQIDIHKIYGGVVPEIASRKHVEVIRYVYEEALKKANIKISDVDLISVTQGPGLVGALLVGLSFAKGLSISTKIPFVGVNHIEGHICANYITNKNLKPPYLSLVVSGGHTYLVEVLDYHKYEIHGKTIDDACGECLDKVARVLGPPYPGGPKLEERAKSGVSHTYPMPYGEVENRPYDFTFSGLKSHTINLIHNIEQKNKKLSYKEINDICKSFQDMIVESLATRTLNLAKENNISTVCMCGGVSANESIRSGLKDI
ncbi:MAG: tRNA (adenosine(37)-N6)-threonylcarbamoyltransferase complex transferase subunit TsaD, partial [Lachnospiraceae bacterium]|nr:tRNA (adenosine(37)-N6)-threonylcarbamoyltransferase complex transferase subunit TsaD [Lachnospiraceae bacterium]